MAGGKGTRIRELMPDVPKPMIEIDGKPVLQREISCLKECGIKDMIITVSHMREKIMDYFGDGSAFGVNIEYFIEETPLGNAGALFHLRDRLTEDFLLLNADSVFNVDFERFAGFHKRTGAMATLFTHPNSHPYDSALIIKNDDGSVENWLSKEDERPLYYDNRVNAGLHVINPAVLPFAEENRRKLLSEGGAVKDPSKWDLDRDVLKPLCGTGKLFAYDSPEYVKDMGTPERFRQVCRDHALNIPFKKNLREKQRAVFLDRDGVINKEVGFCKSVSDFELLPWAARNIKKINESGYLAIVVTNQPVIARGEATFAEVRLMHQKMAAELGKEGAYTDALYLCPHHPDSGFPGEVKELKIKCSCRKPAPGMLLTAARDFNIDLSESFIVGDSERDIKAGEAAGLSGCFLTGTNEEWDPEDFL